MPAKHGRKLRRFLIVAACVVLVAAAVPGTRRAYRAYEFTLFDGTYEDADAYPPHEGNYHVLKYDTTGWGGADNAVSAPPPATTEPGAPDDPDLLDRPREDTGWERLGAPIHPAWQTDARTAATRVARLRSQTVHQESWTPQFLTISDPSDNAVYPPNLCSPFVEWADVHNDFWELTIEVSGRDGRRWRYLVDRRRMRIPDDAWREITALEAGTEFTLRVRGIQKGRLFGRRRESIHRSNVVHFTVSEHPADHFIIYRLVAPPFYNRKTPNMYVRDIREKRDRVFLDARNEYCFNCHTFSSQQGDRGKLALQVRYSGHRDAAQLVYLSLFDLDRKRGVKAILPFEIQMTTWTAWDPGGTKLAISMNQMVQAYGPVTLETQSVGQPTSDLGVYDTTTGRVCLLSGASDNATLEIYPRWTPKGDAIVFSSAPGGHHPIETKYDLMRVPYNSGKGGKAEPVAGASGNGRSNYFARFSPDGRWMTFVQSDYGSLIKASSDLWIMKGDLTEPPRALNCNAPHAADSWHSWSSNSRWIVFTSKRDDGIFARLYLTHIDDDGHASPAVRLPIEDPEMRMSFNIPESVAARPPVDEATLFSNIGLDAEDLKVKPCREIVPGDPTRNGGTP